MVRQKLQLRNYLTRGVRVQRGEGGEGFDLSQMMMWGVTGISGFYTGAIARRLGAATAVTIGGGVVLVNAIRQAPVLVRADSSKSDLNSGC